MKIKLNESNNENDKTIHARILDIYYDIEHEKPVFVCMYKNKVNILDMKSKNLNSINIDSEDIKNLFI